MPEIQWGLPGSRNYELGVDRGVLYFEGLSGIPWNGLISVSEEKGSNSPEAYYLDGIKYANVLRADDFSATITAFSAPNELRVALGAKELFPGFVVKNQERKPFGFCYRTLIGNELEGLSLGYKLHLVYNALASEDSRVSKTLDGSSSAPEQTWSVTTTPPKFPGIRPTAHLIIDSTRMPQELLKDLEDILYGNSGLEARLPEPKELAEILQLPPFITDWLGAAHESESGYFRRTGELLHKNVFKNPSFEKGTNGKYPVRQNLCLNPNFESNTNGWIQSGDASIQSSVGHAYWGTKGLLVSYSNGLPNSGVKLLPSGVASSNELIPETVSFWFKPSGGNASDAMTLTVDEYTNTGVLFKTETVNNFALGAIGVWRRISFTFTKTIATNKVAFSIGTLFPSSGAFAIDCVLIERGSKVNSYFDGSTWGLNELRKNYVSDPYGTSLTATNWKTTANASLAKVETDIVRVTRVSSGLLGLFIGQNNSKGPQAASGVTYRLSMEVRANENTDAQLGIVYGTEIAAQASSAVRIRKDWTRISRSFTVPAGYVGVVSMLFSINNSGINTFDVRRPMLEETALERSYFDGFREIGLEKTRNYIANPAFRESLSGWSSNTVGYLTREASASAVVGGNVLRITRVQEGVGSVVGVTTFCTLNIGEYVLSFYARLAQGTPTYKVQVSGENVSSSENDKSISFDGGSWTKVTLRFSVNADNKTVTIKIYDVPGSGQLYGQQIEIDAVSLIKGMDLTETSYFDGETPRSGLLAAWAGPQNNSESYLYSQATPETVVAWADTENQSPSVMRATSDVDFETAWVGVANFSVSDLRGTFVESVSRTGYASHPVQTSKWSLSGDKSLRLIPSNSSNESRVLLAGYGFSYSPVSMNLIPGKTYTILGTSRLESVQGGTLSSKARAIVARYKALGAASAVELVSQGVSLNEVGSKSLRLEVTLPYDLEWAEILLYNGASIGNGDIFWDNIAIVEGSYSGSYFDGDTI